MPNTTSAKRKVTFTYIAPEAQTVLLAGDFTDWEKGAVSLRKDKTGAWKKTVSLATGKYAYRLLVDGHWCDDPQCANREPNQFGTSNCICIVEGI